MTSSTATISKIVTFRLGDDLFAADIYSVERVLRFQTTTPVPNVPDWIDGVIDYQGRVVPVINLRKRFEMHPGPIGGDTRILVFNVAGEWIGGIVDSVLDVATLDAAKLSPPPAIFRGLAGQYLLGIVRREQRLVVFLDVGRLLSTSERLVLERAAASASVATPATAST
jgi:purine-binding chemotaxis protein CheW